MSRKYSLITGLSAAVVIVAILLCFCFVSFNNIKDVFAFTDETIVSGTVDVGNILLDGYADHADGKVFNGEAMALLYSKLTGNAEKTDINDVTAITTLSAKNIRAKNGNKDIILTFDNKQWTVTYLSKDKSGNTILTLWLADGGDDDINQWNKWYFDDVTQSPYPSNMYSTSYVRAAALNSGGCG